MEDHDVFVVSEAGTPVGAVYLRVENNDTWVELIEVLPDWQGRGLGSGALASVIQRATESHRGTLLQVHKINDRARRLYARLGFVQVDETDTHHVLRHP